VRLGRGDLAAVLACLAAGVSPDAREAHVDRSALHAAASSEEPGGLAVIERLLQAGANPAADADLLERALGFQRAPALFLPRLLRLIEAGARADARAIVAWMEDTSYSAEVRRALRALLPPAATIPLATAVTMRDLDAVRQALARGEDPDQEIDTFPLLHLAACDGGFGEPFVATMPASAAIVEALLAAGASPDVPRPRYRFGDPEHLVPGFPAFGRRADEAPRRALARGVAADRREELERIVAALVRARPAKATGAAGGADTGGAGAP